MKLDIAIINHNYITRMVIFSIFLYKKCRTDEYIYKKVVKDFIRKKTGYTIDIEIDVGPKVTLEYQRDSIIEKILNNDDSVRLNLVVVSFKTSLKDVVIQIDLLREDKYEEYIYI